MAQPSPLLSPPAEEAEVHDPFVVHHSDEESGSDGAAAESDPAPAVSEPSSSTGPTPSAEISLTPTTGQSPAAPPALALPTVAIPSPSPLRTATSLPPASPLNVNKDVPAPPEETSDESSSDELPPLFVPTLVLPQLFLPIPNTDPISMLLAKFIPPDARPPRDVTGEWQRADFHTLVMTNSWRALARMARDRIVRTDPEDVSLILSLWSLRLTSLARLRLFNQASAECTNLFHALDSLPPPARSRLFATILPFELEVFRARTPYWAGDHVGYCDTLAALLARCKKQARAAKGESKESREEREMWVERGARVGCILASQLAEMNDFAAAASLLEPLLASSLSTGSAPDLRSALARVYLQAGQLGAARKHFSVVEDDAEVPVEVKALNHALLAAAEGEWSRAESALKSVVREGEETNVMAVNGLAVALLAQGHISEAIEVLEEVLHATPATVTAAEPFLFNLSTLYELKSVTAVENKRALLIEVARWSGDGLRTACLKMPTT